MTEERTESEKDEAEAEAGPSRPRRSRQAPQRYDSLQNADQQQRSRNTRSASASTRLARLNEEYEREVDFLAKYTYDHVGGQLAEEGNPTVWLDVPDLPDINSYPKASPVVPKKKRKRKAKVNADAGPSSKRAALPNLPVIEEQQAEITEQDTYEVEEMIDTLHKPIQEPLSPLIQPLAILQDDPVTLNTEQGHTVKREVEEDTSIESDQLKKQPTIPAASARLVSAPNSPSPMHFVDASEDFSPLLPNATGNAMKTLPVYHPEMRLSHDKRESFSHISPSRSSVPITSREVKKRKGTHVGHSLFLESDGGEDSFDINQQRSIDDPALRRRSDLSTTLSAALSSSKKTDPVLAASNSATKSTPNKKNPTRATVSPNARAGPSNSSNRRLSPRKDTNNKASPVETSRGETKRKKRGKSANGINYGIVAIASSSDDDLTQNLNIDNYVKSTGNGDSKTARAKQLERLKKLKDKAERRRQGEDSGEGVSSGSEFESESSGEDIDTDSFIVDDTSRSSISKPVEVIPNRTLRTLSPPPLSLPKHQAYVAGLSRKEKSQEYIRWLVIYALEIPIEKDDDTRLRAVRQDLQDKFRMDYRSLLTQANRKQFTWYLTHFPHFERRQMTKREKEEKIGCHACRKKSQRCEYAFTFWGYKYNEKTLEKWSDDHHTSSALSTSGDDLKTVSKNEKKEKQYTFYLGETCAQFASVKHKIYHWERRVLQDVTKLKEYKVLRREDPEDIDGEQIETIVAAYLSTLMKRYTLLESDARDLLTKASTSRQRMSDRWDLD